MTIGRPRDNHIDVTIGEFIGSNVHHYDHIYIELMAYRASLISGAITMNDHKAYRWVTVDQLTEYEFAPADVPFVEMLRAGPTTIT